jgi:hypothetical protein
VQLTNPKGNHKMEEKRKYKNKKGKGDNKARNNVGDGKNKKRKVKFLCKIFMENHLSHQLSHI